MRTRELFTLLGKSTWRLKKLLFSLINIIIIFSHAAAMFLVLCIELPSHVIFKTIVTECKNDWNLIECLL
jgi:hypothetical protein